MKAYQLFANHIKQVHGIEINQDVIVSEAVTMFHDELDPNVFPTEFLKELPDPLLFLTMVYVDQQEQEWIFCFVTEYEDAAKWLHAVCLKDGVLVDRNVPLTIE